MRRGAAWPAGPRGTSWPPTDRRSSARFRPIRVGHAVDPASANHLPVDGQLQADASVDPSTACASFEPQAPTRADDEPVMTRRATTPTSAIPAVRLPAHRPTISLRSDTADAGTNGHRTPDTGHLDAQTPAPDTGHVDRHPWDTGRSHRTLDTGRERGHGDDNTAGIRTSLATTPSDRTLRRQPCLCSRTTSRLLGRFAGQAAPWRIALLKRESPGVRQRVGG